MPIYDACCRPILSTLRLAMVQAVQSTGKRWTQKMPAMGQWETSRPASARYCSHAYFTAAHIALEESCAWLDHVSPWAL